MGMKRIFDLVVSVFLIILSLPLWIIIPLSIRLDSKGGVFYKSRRMGRNERLFAVYKFRTMKPNHDTSGITVGPKDPRITPVGAVLRKWKLDELPQLFNLISGEMALVGPRPDVPGYNQVYKKYNPNHFGMKPGLTSPASIYFMRESEIYEGLDDPRQHYINQVIPTKVELDRVLLHHNLKDDMLVIMKTLSNLIKNSFR